MFLDLGNTNLTDDTKKHLDKTKRGLCHKLYNWEPVYEKHRKPTLIIQYYFPNGSAHTISITNIIVIIIIVITMAQKYHEK